MASILGPPKVGVRRLWQARGTKQTTKGDPLETVPGPESTSTTPPSELNLKDFEQRFPGFIQDGVLDAAGLGAILGIDVSAPKDARERFGLMWAGRQKSIEALQAPSYAALVPDKENSVGWENARNVFIEGDNLEVLKLLQNAYNDQFKLIYLDPPYNTGKDFVYNDDFSDPIRRYLEITGQADSSGNRLVANLETTGRKHSNWLTMMLPRLSLARNLLRLDGVLAISIDDNEVANLRLLLDEVFGPENFEGHIHWRRRHNQPNDPTKMIALVAEHILVYARDSQTLKQKGVGKIPITGDFSNPDADPRGPWGSKPWKVGSNQSGSSYSILTPSGNELNGQWMGERETFDRLVAEGRIYFPNGGKGSPRKKYYQAERALEGQSATNWWPHDKFGHNQEASAELEALFDGKNVFSNPKSTTLLAALMQIANVGPEDLVGDFFAGSGSTAHAVLKLNAQDGGSRRSVSVTLREEIKEGDPGFHLGFRWISDLCLDRIKKSLKSLSDTSGLRVYRLGTSVFKVPASESEFLEMGLTRTSDERPNVRDLMQILLSTGSRLDAEVLQVTDEVYLCGDRLVSIAQEFNHQLEALARSNFSKISSFFCLEDSLAGKDDLKANMYFACKKANITFRTF